MTKIMKSSLLAPLALLAGCLFGSKPTTPSASAGDIPLTVVNGTNRKIVAMIMFPDGTQMDPTNWLGSGPRGIDLSAGKQHAFAVKAGAYRVGFGMTDIYGQFDDRWGATNGVNAEQGLGPALEIQGPTYLVIGDNPVTPPSGVAVVKLPVVDRYGPAAADCKADGVPVDAPEQCCSRLRDEETGLCAVSSD